MDIRAVLFDLDGVIADTAKFHFLAWKAVAEELGIIIDEEFNEQLKGVDRVLSFDRILAHGSITTLKEEKEYYRTKKNNMYRELLESLTTDDVMPGINDFFNELIDNNIKIAIASISQNAPLILEKLNLIDKVDCIADPKSVKLSKPAPDIFLKAAELAGVETKYCVGIEDAKAGIESINNAEIFSVGVGKLKGANLLLGSTSELNLERIKESFYRYYSK
ncbi:beta-phosphoglucomutase [Clostridium estertheticum]|uniref:beta-phosphoglucomutase n=1 Tax=Clostridium estertheticum TaxID=238834 RepID=UPI0013E90761|nr:beta-phosphoglucomutase [Clostridium estertheticum]MBZ9685650.1 beta-phosphoglucomutase [Clostridium estertheticum]